MIRRRWRSLTTKTLSSSSRRRVPIMPSQIALARGAPGGLVRIRMPSAAKTASKALQNLESRSRSTHLTVETRSARSISKLRAAWVVHAPAGCAHPEQMRSAAAMLDGDQDVDPPEQDGVHGHEVHSEDGLGLGGKKLAPGGTRSTRSGRSLWGAGTRPPVLTWVLGGWFVLVDQATENGSALDPFF